MLLILFVFRAGAEPRTDGIKAVFMGDSITEGWCRPSSGHPEFFSENGFVGKGKGGQTTSQMLARFNTDVLALDPECVVICGGTNDIAGNAGPVTDEAIVDNIKAMAEMAEQSGIRVILCSILPCDRYYWKPGLNPAERIVHVNALIREYAREKGFDYVDYHAAMADDADALPAEYTSDGCHPLQSGYSLMEKIILPVINCTGLWLEAEAFRDKGGWVVDQQFMDLLGSPYLMAHGMGRKVEDAVTEVEIPRDGIWHVYVRTFNWTAPWTSADGPGAFKVKVGGKILRNVLGTSGDRWQWQYAGQVRLEAGRTPLALHDLSGFNGRCDAVFMTMDKDARLPQDGEALAAFRRTRLAAPESEASSYDFVVLGGGIAGMCAAVSAARLGSRVALVNDRPVLGGNNSAEVRVHLGGHVEIGPNKGLGRMIREFGHARKGNAQPAANYEDERKQAFIDAEPGVDLYPSFRAVEVKMDGNRIKAVKIRHIETAEEKWLEAPLFSDCTGDATVGFLAGADWRMGREARHEFGESLAPETADDMTMGASVQWYTRRTDGKSSFPEFSYGVEFNDGNCEEVTMGEWKWETGMNRDQIYDAERIRDYGLLVVYSNWSWLKNHHQDKDSYACRELEWVAYIAGKRESRRLMGDYILKQDDIDKNVFHEDGSFTASWSIDLHFPDPDNSEKFPGEEFKAATVHNWIYPCTVPYRCLYSRNIDNLFMAGRNISVTHVALGTVRVMRTTGMMGEVVGMAASLCRRYGCTPRQVYQDHLEELKELMQTGVGKTEGLNDQTFNCADRLLDAPRAALKN